MPYSPSTRGNPEPDLARRQATARMRGIADLRRGAAVLAHADGQYAIVAAADGQATDAFDLLCELSGQSPDIVIAMGRARALGLPSTGADPVQLTRRPDCTDQAWRSFVGTVADPDAPPRGNVFAAQTVPDRVAAATLALLRQAGLLPIALVVPISFANETSAAGFATHHDLLLVPAQVADTPAPSSAGLVETASARVPLALAQRARIVAFRPEDGGQEHFAIIVGEPEVGQPVLTRVHSSCFTGDVLGSLRCDCGEQLEGAVKRLEEEGGGVILYLAQEGRGIGLTNKLRAYQLQDTGRDTMDANVDLGFAPDERSFEHAAEMLRRLGIRAIRLLTNNPSKVAAVQAAGVTVTERVSHRFPPSEHNAGYLDAKARRFGHFL